MASPTLTHASQHKVFDLNMNEKTDLEAEDVLEGTNPVVSSSDFACRAANVVQISDEGVRIAANHIRQKLRVESYTPRTWRAHALHICPNEPYDTADPLNKSVLDWIFLISALNFSFWSEKEGRADRYGVEWRESWSSSRTRVWTGYWSLVAALNRALADDGVPITDPNFYSSETLCPDSLIQHIFRPAAASAEGIPLLQQRISIMREVGFILCNGFGGSYQGFINEFQRGHDGQGTALDLVKMVTEMFPSFRDEVYYEGQKVCFWKRAQILVAETWAAFFPADAGAAHPIFRGTRGPQIHDLTMFADYRVPQILHHLRILSYPPALVRTLRAGTPLESGCREEVSLRAASIVAVERVRAEILRLMRAERTDETPTGREARAEGEVSSVLIDFYLWDLAKKIESGAERIEGMETAEMLPIHRTRSIWY